MSIKEMTEYDFKLNIIEGKKYIWSTLTKLFFFFFFFKEPKKHTHTRERERSSNTKVLGIIVGLKSFGTKAFVVV